MRKLFSNKWDLLHRIAQSYKVSNKNDLFCTWRDFNKTFCGISTYHKWMFKLQISTIFNFDRTHQSWISGVLGVKEKMFRIVIWHIFWRMELPLLHVVFGPIVRSNWCWICRNIIEELPSELLVYNIATKNWSCCDFT